MERKGDERSGEREREREKGGELHPERPRFAIERTEREGERKRQMS